MSQIPTAITRLSATLIMPGPRRIWKCGPIRQVLYKDRYKEGRRPLIAVKSGPVKPVEVCWK